MSIQLYNQWWEPLNNEKPTLPSVSLIRIPPLYSFDLENSADPIISLTDPSGGNTTSDGNYTFNLKIKKCYTGDYIVSLMFGTAFSFPLLFSTTMPVTDLSITTEGLYPGSSPYLFGTFPTTPYEVTVTQSGGSDEGFIIAAYPDVQTAGAFVSVGDQSNNLY